MHELSIARSICEAAARESRGNPVGSMIIDVGALAGVSADALEFCITEIARETGLGRPAIVIETSPARFKCECGGQYDVSDVMQACPSCGDYRRQIVSGLDIFIKEMTYEEPKHADKAKKSARKAPSPGTHCDNSSVKP